MRFVLAIMIGVIISPSAFCQECKNPSDCPQSNQSNDAINWDKKLTTYDVGNTSFYDYGLHDDKVSPPTYSNLNEAPPTYPFGNAVKLGNGVSCIRDGVTISCK